MILILLDVEQTMKAHSIKMFKIYWKAVRDGGDHPNEPEKYDDENNESEKSEDVDNPTSLSSFCCDGLDLTLF